MMYIDNKQSPLHAFIGTSSLLHIQVPVQYWPEIVRHKTLIQFQAHLQYYSTYKCSLCIVSRDILFIN